jgi:hypothetical protein
METLNRCCLVFVDTTHNQIDLAHDLKFLLPIGSVATGVGDLGKQNDVWDQLLAEYSFLI